jgi:hypothetical protein
MIEFTVVGGNISMDKDIFIKEMLFKDSLLRQILNWRGTGDFKGNHPMVGKPDENGRITINFSSTNCVSVGQDPRDFLSKLKQRYREKIKGWVSCRGSYEHFGGVYFIRLDLNSDDDIVEYI